MNLDSRSSIAAASIATATAGASATFSNTGPSFGSHHHAGVRMTHRTRALRITGHLLSASLFTLALGAGQARANTTPLTQPPTSWEVEDFADSSIGNNGLPGTNPSGVWSYGFETTLGANFQLLTQPVQPDQYNPNLDIKGWMGNVGDPGIYHNVNVQPWDNGAYNYPYPITIPPRGVFLAPGSSCKFATLRFTAPYAGRYKINGQFDGLDGWSVNGLEQNVKVYILVNSNTVSPLYGGTVHTVAGQKTASFTPKTTAALAVGDTVDFIVGCGPNNDFWFGATGLRGVVQYAGKKRP